ncbi:hypothetical protein EON83_02655 [bacterium]|nr:MAG: hypothetical protein EON83_02655 [bacterium]
MSTALMSLERASLFGMAALVMALLGQLVLDGRVPAAWRVWLWRVALLQTAFALAPIAPLRLAVLPSTVLVKEVALPVSASVAPFAPPQSVSTNLSALVPPVVESPIKVASPPAPSAPTRPIVSDAASMLLVVYALGLGLQFVVLACCFVRVRASLRACESIEEAGVRLQLQNIAGKMQVSPLPRLLNSDANSPCLVGILHPVILLPTSLIAAQNSDIEAVISHELAHLKRRDLIWNAILWLVQALLWFHPLVWVGRRFLALETESACDEMVLSSTRATPLSYGSLLLNTMNSPSMPLTAGINDSFFALKKRLSRLNQVPTRPRRAFQIVFVAALCLALGAPLPLRFVARAQSTKPSIGQTQSPTRQYTTNRRIPQNDTPEVEVGLPATLEEARGNATITGRVVYENGKPASGIRVDAYCRWLSQTELWGYRRNQANHYRWPDKINKLLSGTAVTRADGSYRFTGLLPQRYGIRLSGDRWGNHAPVGLLAPRSVRVVAVARQSRRAPDTVLRPSAQIRIRALDQDSGVPLEGLRWSGFIVEDSSKQPMAWVVDARKGDRPMKGFTSEGATDENGYCTLSLDAGKAYFFLSGALHMGVPAGERPGTWSGLPDKFITSNGLYKSEAWCEVTQLTPTSSAKQTPQRAWNGETEFQLKKGQPANFVVRLKRYKPLTPEYRALLKHSQQMYRR